MPVEDLVVWLPENWLFSQIDALCDSAKIEENGQDIVCLLNRIQYIVVIRKEKKMSLNNVESCKKMGQKRRI